MTGSHSSRSSIESLEDRRLLSADLTGVFGNQIPAQFKTGNGNHVSVQILNDGDAKAAGPVTVDLFAAPTSDGSGNTLLSEVTRVMNLKPGRESKVNFRFAEPTDLPDGSYSLVAQISSNSIANTINTNDIVTAPASVTLKKPFADVTAQAVNAPTQSILIDGAFERQEPASVTIVNRGTAKAVGQVSVDFYLSKDTILDQQDVLAGSILSTGIKLNPGARTTFKTEIGAPLNAPAGQYYLFAVVSSGAGIVQGNPADGIGLAGRQVQVVVVSTPTVSHPVTTSSQSVDYSGLAYQCTPGQANATPSPADDTGTPCDTGQPCDNSASPCDNTGQPCDNSGQQDDSGQPCDNSGQPTDDNSDPSDDSSQPSDNSGQPDDSSGQSDQSGQDNTSSQDDTSSSDTADNSDNTFTDDSSDTSSDDSSGTSNDDSSDTSSDDSSDDSGETSSDDSGGDDSEDDSIARRSTTSVAHKEPEKVALPKGPSVVKHAPSTQSHAKVYKTPERSISGGHR